MAERRERNGVLRKFLCWVGKHERDAKMARKRHGVWYTHCVGCRVDMLKRDDGAGWVVPQFEPTRRRTRKPKRSNV